MVFLNDCLISTKEKNSLKTSYKKKCAANPFEKLSFFLHQVQRTRVTTLKAGEGLVGNGKEKDKMKEQPTGKHNASQSHKNLIQTKVHSFFNIQLLICVVSRQLVQYFNVII